MAKIQYECCTLCVLLVKKLYARIRAARNYMGIIKFSRNVYFLTFSLIRDIALLYSVCEFNLAAIIDVRMVIKGCQWFEKLPMAII